ncbi:MAG TPA: DUF4384 domain-containing protein [Candidatus Angelobacter sp.]|nr:DUF4384 domain-containing protein [Candidatus Angelobacter sp.]
MIRKYRIIALSILALASVMLVRGQDATRHIWDTAFLSPKADKATQGQAAHKPRYTVLTPRIPVQTVDPGAVVGVTVWRLHEYKKGDAGERLLVHGGSKPIEFAPKRVSARTLFKRGDKVRVTVEAAREGYLYVVDRERYTHGKQGEPYLIFPAATIRGGENHIVPGQIVEIPAQDDDPPYFNLRQSRPDQMAEQLTILISPTPIQDVQPGENGQRLSPEQCAQWEQHSHVDAGMAEIKANVALDWSREEKNAGRDPAISLPPGAPPPQTLFYSTDANAQSPTIVKLVLNYAPPVPPLRQSH